MSWYNSILTLYVVTIKYEWFPRVFPTSTIYVYLLPLMGSSVTPHAFPSPYSSCFISMLILHHILFKLALSIAWMPSSLSVFPAVYHYSIFEPIWHNTRAGVDQSIILVVLLLTLATNNSYRSKMKKAWYGIIYMTIVFLEHLQISSFYACLHFFKAQTSFRFQTERRYASSVLIWTSKPSHVLKRRFPLSNYMAGKGSPTFVPFLYSTPRPFSSVFSICELPAPGCCRWLLGQSI